MIITLPRSLMFLINDEYFPIENPVFEITGIKDGVMIYNLKNELMGQAILDRDIVKVTIAEGNTFILRKDQTCNSICFNKLELDDILEGEEDTVNNDFRDVRKPYVQYSFSGDAKDGVYEIFEIIEGKRNPKKYFKVTDNKYKKYLADIEVFGDGNILKAVLIFYGISLLVF